MQMRSLRWWLLVAAMVVIARALPLSGQQAAANPDVLRELLGEVRGLRAAMEQLASAGPRVQLAMGRLQLQEQRVNTMLRRLDTLREQITSVEREAADMREQLLQLEEETKRNENPEIRQAASDRTRQLKVMLQRSAADLQRLTVEEAEVAGMVSAEQGRWADINRRLEDLEAALSRR